MGKTQSYANSLIQDKQKLSGKNVYFIYVRPLINYSNSVWDNCSTEWKNQLEWILKESARVITGATKFCSIEQFFADLGWESLQNRRNKHKLVIFCKILHGIAPTYLSFSFIIKAYVLSMLTNMLKSESCLLHWIVQVSCLRLGVFNHKFHRWTCTTAC